MWNNFAVVSLTVEGETHHKLCLPRCGIPEVERDIPNADSVAAPAAETPNAQRASGNQQQNLSESLCATSRSSWFLLRQLIRQKSRLPALNAVNRGRAGSSCGGQRIQTTENRPRQVLNEIRGKYVDGRDGSKCAKDTATPCRPLRLLTCMAPVLHRSPLHVNGRIVS